MGMTTAQLRAYQQLCGTDGRLLVIAMDQRNSMRTLIRVPSGEASDADLLAAKLDLVRHLGNAAPAVLLDPTVAIPQVVDEGILARDCALLVGMDATGYATGDDGLRVSRVVEGVDARRVRAVGGTAAKLNVYMRPDVQGIDAQPARLIASVLEDCAREDVLLVVEILTYALPGESPEEYAAKMPDLVAGAAAIARRCGAEVAKLQFAGSEAGCRAVTDALEGVPWAVLSAGVDHATFLGQLRTAIAGGASGAIAGRSLWKDCLAGESGERARLLREVAVPRLRELQAVLAEGRA